MHIHTHSWLWLYCLFTIIYQFHLANRATGIIPPCLYLADETALLKKIPQEDDTIMAIRSYCFDVCNGWRCGDDVCLPPLCSCIRKKSIYHREIRCRANRRKILGLLVSNKHSFDTARLNKPTAGLQILADLCTCKQVKYLHPGNSWKREITVHWHALHSSVLIQFLNQYLEMHLSTGGVAKSI